MKSLVIAEKPSVGRDIARVLHCSKNIPGALTPNVFEMPPLFPDMTRKRRKRKAQKFREIQQQENGGARPSGS